ncbi:helix-turn-helix domain-containing protein [Aestuariivirga sp.]|uniref:helix-turn-helix domain-containing protein n=1 Tax=Aestuariivirga sp. TaxID=2650926 RepID=UPI003458D4B3
MQNGKWEEDLTRAIDRHVGRRLRTLRTSRRHSVLRLATLMGLPAFDLARIESGTRRLSIPELWTLTRIYGVEPRFFFRFDRRGEDKVGNY